MEKLVPFFKSITTIFRLNFDFESIFVNQHRYCYRGPTHQPPRAPPLPLNLSTVARLLCLSALSANRTPPSSTPHRRPLQKASSAAVASLFHPRRFSSEGLHELHRLPFFDLPSAPADRSTANPTGLPCFNLINLALMLKLNYYSLDAKT
jgi:hypothetical protein